MIYFHFFFFFFFLKQINEIACDDSIFLEYAKPYFKGYLLKLKNSSISFVAIRGHNHVLVFV